MSDRVEEYDRQLLEYKLAKCRQRADCMNSSRKAFRSMAACRAKASDSKVDEKGSETLVREVEVRGQVVSEASARGPSKKPNYNFTWNAYTRLPIVVLG